MLNERLMRIEKTENMKSKGKNNDACKGSKDPSIF